MKNKVKTVLTISAITVGSLLTSSAVFADTHVDFQGKGYYMNSSRDGKSNFMGESRHNKGKRDEEEGHRGEKSEHHERGERHKDEKGENREHNENRKKNRKERHKKRRKNFKKRKEILLNELEAKKLEGVDVSAIEQMMSEREEKYQTFQAERIARRAMVDGMSQEERQKFRETHKEEFKAKRSERREERQSFITRFKEELRKVFGNLDFLRLR